MTCLLIFCMPLICCLYFGKPHSLLYIYCMNIWWLARKKTTLIFIGEEGVELLSSTAPSLAFYRWWFLPATTFKFWTFKLCVGTSVYFGAFFMGFFILGRCDRWLNCSSDPFYPQNMYLFHHVMGHVSASPFFLFPTSVCVLCSAFV